MYHAGHGQQQSKPAPSPHSPARGSRGLCCLTVNAPTTADTLASQTNCPGDTVSFSTTAHGTGPFGFQWARNGTPLSGQTGNSLTLSSITAASAGPDSVRVAGPSNGG